MELGTTQSSLFYKEGTERLFWDLTTAVPPNVPELVTKRKVGKFGASWEKECFKIPILASGVRRYSLRWSWLLSQENPALGKVVSWARAPSLGYGFVWFEVAIARIPPFWALLPRECALEEILELERVNKGDYPEEPRNNLQGLLRIEICSAGHSGH